MRQWINYGQEDIGQVAVEEGNDNPSINLDKTGETLPPKTGLLTGATIQDIKNFLTNKDILVLAGMLTFIVSLVIISITLYKIKKLQYSI